MTFTVGMQSVSAGNAQKSWEELAARGFEMLSSGRSVAAANAWLEADAGLPTSEVPFDPLRAASRSNAGIAYLILGKPDNAKECFDDAERTWENIIAGIETLDVPLTGASSSFHFRLAATTPSDLTAARRREYRDLASVALAITRLNRAPAQRCAAANLVVSEILGSMSPEARLLSASATSIEDASITEIFADKFADISCRRPTFAAALSTECAELENAVMLTALLPPSIFHHLRTEKHTTAKATHNEFE